MVGVSLWKLAWRNLAELLEIFVGHPNVGVIVPGNETAVSHGTKSRAGIDEVGQIILSANSIDNGKNLTLFILEPL